MYSAYEPSLDRVVAVKVLTSSDRDQTDRFLREVQLMGNLTGHPNIAPVFWSGVTADGHAFLVMPYYPEGSLNDLVAARRALEVKEVLRVGVKLCGAIETVHGGGIIHGDIKPHNVLFTSYHEPVLTDFGVALQIDAAITSQVAFSPGYVAPEIINGDAPMSPASDVFSLALTIASAAGHEAWTPGEPLERILARRSAREELSERVDPGLRAVLLPAPIPLPALDRRPASSALHSSSFRCDGRNRRPRC
ncbi:MAG: serine/threonine-protein kinase [Ilumatobacteraceae bacterium]